MSNIPDSIKKEIAESINGPKHLNLSNLGLNDNDLTELQELLEKKSNTSSIDLSYNNVTSQGCRILCLLTQLRTLNLIHQGAGALGLQARREPDTGGVEGEAAAPADPAPRGARHCLEAAQSWRRTRGEVGPARAQHIRRQAGQLRARPWQSRLGAPLLKG